MCFYLEMSAERENERSHGKTNFTDHLKPTELSQKPERAYKALSGTRP